MFLLWQTVLHRGRPDIIHLQWQHGFFKARHLPVAILLTCTFFLQWLTLRLLGVRFVWTIHNVVNHERIQARWELLASRLLARVVDARIVLCNAAREIVAATYRIPIEGIEVVPQGNYMDWYPKPLDKSRARHMLGFETASRIFLCFGSIRPYKGIDRLLDAFRMLRDPDARLVLIGKPNTPDLAQSLSEKAALDPRVTCRFEFIDEELLIQYLSACDFAIFSHVDILASASVMLAASCGRAVIVPEIGCLREFPAEAAILYDPAIPGAIETALGKGLIADVGRMGVAMGAFASRNSWEESAKAILKVYHSVSRGGGRHAGDENGEA